MILVGQNDSPFVRRVAVTLRHYGMAYQRKPLSVFADYDAVRALHPLGRVPILLLDGGETLADSAAILDAIAGLNAVGIAHPTKLQAGFWAGYRPSGTFDTYLSRLRTQGLLSYPVAGCDALTAEGAAIARADLPAPQTPGTGAKTHRMVLRTDREGRC